MRPISENTDTIDDRKAVIQPINKFWYENKVAAIDMLRLDLLHPVVSGNKWYKLRLNVADAQEKGYKKLLTFGGGFSNHLVATAYAARMFGLQSVAIVRGKHEVLTPTLRDCVDYGMELIFVTREDYNNKHMPEWLAGLVADFDSLYIIPEGGANEKGRAGAGLISWYIHDHYTHIATAVGSGTTLVGLRNKLPATYMLMGYAPMKDGKYMQAVMNEHIEPALQDKWQLFDEWHFGGFGKCPKELIGFINDFYRETTILLDIVYTGKMMYGIKQQLSDNYFSSSDRILCIHSGGLQGNVTVKEALIF